MKTTPDSMRRIQRPRGCNRPARARRAEPAKTARHVAVSVPDASAGDGPDTPFGTSSPRRSPASDGISRARLKSRNQLSTRGQGRARRGFVQTGLVSAFQTTLTKIFDRLRQFDPVDVARHEHRRVNLAVVFRCGMEPMLPCGFFCARCWCRWRLSLPKRLILQLISRLAFPKRLR